MESELRAYIQGISFFPQGAYMILLYVVYDLYVCCSSWS